MKCSVQSCPGNYEVKHVAQTLRRDGHVIVIDHVPADVCDVCGDVLFAPETVRRIEDLLKAASPPDRTAPVYEFA
jgi:YgiT-type zinc finger domain-containing protein